MNYIMGQFARHGEEKLKIEILYPFISRGPFLRVLNLSTLKCVVFQLDNTSVGGSRDSEPVGGIFSQHIAAADVFTLLLKSHLINAHIESGTDIRPHF